VATLVLLSKIPLLYIVKRLAIILPILSIIAISLPFITPGNVIYEFHLIVPLKITDIGLANFFSVIIKALLALSVMIVLTTTTRFRDLMFAMQRLHIPSIIISIIGFMYRYIFLFTDEFEKMNMGRESRTLAKNNRLKLKGLSWMTASLFIRSIDRGDRIYQAMCSRGFQGEFKTLTEMQSTIQENVFTVIFVITIISIKIIGIHYG